MAFSERLSCNYTPTIFGTFKMVSLLGHPNLTWNRDTTNYVDVNFESLALALETIGWL